ncbi:MAG: hypothetical protein J6M01_04110, partial [Prevotella sp.]|nr:hypothetical protein [Prevotella sp.]
KKVNKVNGESSGVWWGFININRGEEYIYIITFFILDNNIIIMEILLCLKRPAIHHSLYSLFGFAGAGVRQKQRFGL